MYKQFICRQYDDPGQKLNTQFNPNILCKPLENYLPQKFNGDSRLHVIIIKAAIYISIRI